VSYSADDFEVDLAFLFGGVDDFGEEGDDAEGDVERDAVFDPLVLVGEFLHQEALVLLHLLQSPVVNAVGSPGALVGVVDLLVLGAYVMETEPAGMSTTWG
jgi:hypothetical protein